MEIHRGRAATGAGTEGMGFVDDDQRPGPRGKIAHGGKKSGIGVDDPDVGHRRLGQNARDVAMRQRLRERGPIIELDHPGGLHRINRRTNVARPHLGNAILQDDQRLVHRAVITPIENQDPGPAGNHSSEPDREAIGIRGAESELPVGETKAASQFLRHPERVLRREHGRDPARRLAMDRLEGVRRGMTGHGAGVSQTQIEVLEAIDVGEICASRGRHKHGESPCPFLHPVHRDALEQRFPSAIVESPRTGMGVEEALLFERVLTGEVGAGNHGRGS